MAAEYKILPLIVGKIEFNNQSEGSFSERITNYISTKDSINIALTVEGDNVNVWYDDTHTKVIASAKFTGTVHFRIG